MRYEPIGPIEATEFELAGAPMAAVAVNDRAHVMDGAMFRLLFRPADEPREMRPEPIDTEAIKRGPRRERNHAEALKSSPVRRRIAASVAALDLTGYPEALRDPRSTTLRAIWDALGVEPSGVSGIERTTGLSNKQVSMALMGLRDKCLVHKRDSDGAWERTREE